MRPVKRSFSLNGHRTSISLEEPFWEALREAADREGVPTAVLVSRIDEGRKGSGLSGAVRIWILDYFRNRSRQRSYDGGNRD
ncbi:MAG: ribbon-helix-helix domain-containing protein [Hyphomicrobium sp.]|nr:ribbon-helix-helix domain-containing protein [Hyphomicrobium sp.]